MDSVTPETRSRVMARVRSRGNRSTEWRLRAALVQAGIRGWTLDPSGLPGKPDFVFHENFSLFAKLAFSMRNLRNDTKPCKVGL